MDEKQLRHKSKFLSLVLRHKPEQIGISLDEHGWADIHDLLERVNASGVKLSRDILEEIVEKNDKKRFIISEDGTRIRANQGHSIKVELDLKERRPPDLLYHGTVERVYDSIKVEGLKKMSRHHVHLSPDVHTARKVAGRRRTKSIVLEINAKEMFEQGYKFYLSENGVWLTDNVPFNFISLL